MADQERGGLQVPSWVLAPLIGGVLWLALGFNVGLNIYDEGLTAYGATRVLQGDVVYRDFLSLYGPANFYVVAALFKLIGPSLLVLRTYSLLLEFLLALVICALALRVASPAEALLASFLVITIQQPDSGAALTPALLLGFGGLWCLLATSRLFAAGALIGLAALFRHDTALVFALAGCACIGTGGGRRPGTYASSCSASSPSRSFPRRSSSSTCQSTFSTST